MARLFDDAASDKLLNANGVVTAAPLAMACFFKSDDGAQDNQYPICLSVAGAVGHYVAINYNTTASSPDGTRVITSGYSGLKLAQTVGDWTANQWNHSCCLYVSNTDRRIFLDGSGRVQNTDDDGGVATLDQTTIGCRETTIFDGFASGSIAEAAIWDLSAWPGATASDKADAFEKIIPALAAGFSPSFYRLGLSGYWPLVRGLNDVFGGYNMTASGTVVAAHSRIIYPSQISVVVEAAAAPPAGDIPLFAHHYKMLKAS